MYPWETWFEEDGAEGTEPPEEIKELWDWNEQRLQTLIGSEGVPGAFKANCHL